MTGATWLFFGGSSGGAQFGFGDSGAIAYAVNQEIEKGYWLQQ